MDQPTSAEHNHPTPDPAELACERLTHDHLYAFYFRNVTCSFADGVLTLHGRVPTYHLKQILQTKLLDLPGVTRLQNDVDVVSSTGLSSVPRKPR